MTYWLSAHVRYRCQHAGACCTARWPIPLERTRVDVVRRAIGDGRIDVRETWLTPAAGAPEDVGGMLAMDVQGHCVFHQRDRCAIHGACGHAALPSACQHFPRVCLIDSRGVFVTLSHFCPTAASMLFDEAPVSIVDGPAALPDGERPEGLDVREAWPPLLTDRVLMDQESYGLWERHMIETLAGSSCETSAEGALARLRMDAQRLSRWRPGSGALISAVQEVAEAKAPALRTEGNPVALFQDVRRAVVSPLVWPSAPAEIERTWSDRVAPTWPEWAPVVRRFLAAHAFASWLAYQGRGIATVVRGLDAALAVLQIELVRVCPTRRAALDGETLQAAIRQADLLLRHYVDRQAFADVLSGRG